MAKTKKRKTEKIRPQRSKEEKEEIRINRTNYLGRSKTEVTPD